MLVVGVDGWAAIPLRADGVFEFVGERLEKPDGTSEWVQVLRPRPDVTVEQYEREVERIRLSSRYGPGAECEELDTEISASKTRRMAPRPRSATKRPRKTTAAQDQAATPAFTIVW